ncbi:sacsin-like isoform X3 [Sycon ciliatum]|uniref:sacsin-like isoform X3 n=1 Tax=Sycon ciliatum TaxID=27933 RepID=UPI0031F6D329
MSADDDGCRETYVSVTPPPLITFIKNVLKDYPDGGQTLKELLQNANDAGATRVQFLLNCEQYSAGDLIHANMAPLQGPALYEYNDGVFANSDWKGICHPSRSKKRKDVMKVGRFGIGFNSVYHLTDVPGILSGTHVCFIDPMLCHITDPSGCDSDSDGEDYDDDDDPANATGAKRRSGQEMIKYTVKGFAGRFRGQASAFNVLEHRLAAGEKSFTGTLFRFPLRQNQHSKLSKTVYNEEDVEKKLFASFQKEADIMLLFLANIRSLELFKQPRSSAAKRILHVTYTCIGETDPDTEMSQRLRIAMESKTLATLETRMCVTVHSGNDSSTARNWLVRHTVGSNDANICEIAGKENLHPWVGIAAPINDDANWSKRWLTRRHESSCRSKAFCFLPITPIETGLPVHVHGYFAVTSDRRSVKWPCADNTSDEANWNMQLVQSCLSSAYVETLKRLTDGCHFTVPDTIQPGAGDDDDDKPVCRAYYAWPDMTRVERSENSPWRYLVQCMLPLLFEEKLLWSWARGGSWLAVKDAWIMEATCNQAMQAAAVQTGHNRGIAGNVVQAVYAFLLAMNEPVVLLPPSVMATLSSTSDGNLKQLLAERTIQPASLRQIIGKLQASSPACGEYMTANRKASCAMASFILSDFDVDSSTTQPEAATMVKEIESLAIFPTLHLATIRSLSDGRPLYVLPDMSSYASILPGMGHVMLDTGSITAMDHTATDTLKHLALLLGSSHPTFQLLRDDHVPELLVQSIQTWSPAFQRGHTTSIAWSADGAENCPPLAWLEDVWKWSGESTLTKDHLEPLEGLPLIPAIEGLLCLCKQSTIVIEGDSLEDTVNELLTVAGCTVIAEPPGFVHHNCAGIIGQYILPHRPTTVMTALVNVERSSSVEEVNRRIASLSIRASQDLLAFLATASPNEFTSDQKELLRKLQIYVCHSSGLTMDLASSGKQHYLLPRNLPQDVLSLKLPVEFVRPTPDGKEESLLNSLSCPQLTCDELLVAWLLPTVTWPVNITILNFAMELIATSKLKKESLQRIRTMAFVPCSPSRYSLARPTDLVDPKDVLAHLYDHSEHCFPHVPEGINEDNWLPGLRMVGLRKEAELTAETKVEVLKDRVSSVSRIMTGSADQEAARKRTVNVIQFISRLELLASCGQYIQEEARCFMAQLRPPSHDYPTMLPWCGEDNKKLYTPMELVAMPDRKQATLLVGSSASLLDDDLFKAIGSDEKKLQSFGLKTVSDLHDVAAKHLRQLIETLPPQGQASVMSGKTRQYYDQSCFEVYRYLKPLHGADESKSESIVRTYLKERDWVWLSTQQQCRFVSPHRLLYSLPEGIQPENLQPYRYQMSDECKVLFQPFFKAFGSSTCLVKKDLVDILHEVRGDTPDGGRMSDSQLKLVLDIIKSPAMISDNGDRAVERKILLPTSNSTLVDAERCRFCDCGFLLCPAKGIELNTVSRYNVLHRDLDESIARRYKVPALSLDILPSSSLPCTVDGKPRVLYSEEIASIQTSDTLEQTSEELFFKEMLENAEDAGATRVQFTLDSRHTAPDSRDRTLLSEDLKQWQAPALWFHNDAEFSAADLENIRRLKTKAKRLNPTLIGHKGLGFSRAYHLTDVPSLVSQERIIFFDPVGKSFGVRSSPEEPVVMVDFIKHQDGVSVFADQFSTYHGTCGCHVLSPTACKYPGTLFRFPLRSKPSKISSHCPSTVKLREKLAELAKSMDQLLIFLQHIKEVTIDVIHENGSQELLCHWQAEVDQHIAGDPLVDKLLFTTTQRCDGSWNRMCENMVTMSRKGGVPPFTVYKLIMTDKTHNITSNCLVVGMFGGNASLKSAEKLKAETGIARLPWVMLAARFHGRPPCVQRVSGKLHRALATSISTRLPVHINAFFKLSATGARLEERGASGDWNSSLLKNDVPKAYSLLVSGMKERMEQEHAQMTDDMARTVYSVLPLTALEDNPWTDLQRNVLKEVTSNIPFLWTSVGSGQWLNLSSAIILDRLSFNDQRLASYARDILVAVGEKYVGHNTGDDEDLLSRIVDLSGQRDGALTCQSFFHDKFMSNLLSLTDEQVDNGLKMLIRLGQNQPDTCSWSVPLLEANKCVRSQAGQLCFPGELIDPHTEDKRIRYLFETCPSMWPSDTLRDISVFLSEKKLLLSGVDTLPVSLLLQAAKYIAGSSTDGVDKQAVSYLCGIIAERIRNEPPGNQFLQDLRTVPFLPVMQRPGDWHLPWKAEEPPVFVASIADLVPKCQRAVGSVALLLDIDPDVECSWLFSQCSLDMDSPPSLEDMKQQIQVLTAIVASEKPAHDNQRNKPKVLEVLLNVGRCMDRIYGFMKQHMASNTDQFDAAGFGDMTCIWSDQHAMFKLPCEAAMSAPEGYPDLMPFRLIVDRGHTSKYAGVFSRISVKDALDVTDLHAILSSLHANYQDKNGQRTPLSKEHRDLAIKLIEVLHKLKALTVVPGGELLLPTMKGLMLPASQCNYIDREEFSDLLQGTDRWTELWDNVVHSRLASIAQHLGAESLSKRLLPSESMEYETDDLEFERVAYGQELTDRLAHILEDYPADETIVKELVQNADDAGAGSVKFVLDWRDWRQGTGALLNKEMREWQGPALLVYNDAVFNENDFRNIMKLGGATKKDDPGKIGRFGLGFSSVYHLTDLPSFVSGNYIVFFDPHTKYLGPHRVSKDSPAIKINFVRNRKGLEPFSEQFKPYHNIFGCNMNDAYEGTLFRLPLRSPNTASKICIDPVNIRDVFKKCWSKLSDMMLYLQCVRQIEVYEIRSEDCKPTLLFAGQSNICSDDRKEAEWAKQGLRRLHELHSDSLHEYIAAQHPTKSGWYTGRIRVSSSMTPDGLKCFNMSASHGSAAAQDWLLCAGLGTAESKDLAVKEGRKDSLVPWGGCAIKWNAVNDIAEPDLAGIAYSFLPLPIATGLPFHLNACLSVAKDRRSLEHTSDGSLKTRWNEAVLSDVITHAYLHLLESIASHSTQAQPEQRSAYGQLFPATDGSSIFSYRALIVARFYNMILRNGSFAVFWCPARGQWMTGKESLFLVDYDRFGDCYDHAVELLAGLDVAVVEQPVYVRQELKKMCSLVDSDYSAAVQSIDFQTFYTRYFFPQCERIPHDSHAQFLKLLLAQEEEHWSRGLLKYEKCIRSSSGRMVRCSQLVDRESDLAELYTDDDGKFAAKHYDFAPGHLLVLRQCGMIHEKLPNEEIIGRAKSVLDVSRDCGKARAHLLLVLLSRPGYIGQTSTIKSELQHIEFLPVAPKPDTYHMSWAGDGQSFVSAAESQTVEFKHLAGSVQPLADLSVGKRQPSRLAKCLGYSTPTLNTVLEQLDIMLSENKELQENIDDEEAVLQCLQRRPTAVHQDKPLLRFLREASSDIFKYLDTAVCGSEAAHPIDATTEEELITFLSSKIWFWHGNRFVSIETLSTGDSPLSGYPPFFNSSDNYNKYPNLWKLLRIADTYNPAYVRRVMCIIYSVYKARTSTGEEYDRICKLLRELAEQLVKPGPLAEDARRSVVLPGADGCLHYLNQLTFDNTPWLNSAEKRSTADGSALVFAHGDIPWHLAKRLGMEHASHRLVESAGMDFGQQERLCDRLAGILEKYPADISIFKELIQNADDAGATAMHFILDTRVDYPDERLLNPNTESWKQLQHCPSLCVYNNRSFTDKDIEGIAKLGSGSKRDDPKSTGRFGIGFNAVYHLTDCPSFLSRGANGTNLCFFDPLLNFEPHATDAQPGRRFKQTTENEAQFCDQWEPYLGTILNNTMASDGESTVFRLPLRGSYRTEAKIGRDPKSWTTSNVEALFHELCEHGIELLLFLKNVASIRVSVHTKADGLDTWYRISRERVTEETSIPRGVPEKAMSIHYVQDTCLKKQDGNESRERWLMMNCSGVDRMHHSPAAAGALSLDEAITEGHRHGLSPEAGVAARLPMLASPTNRIECATGKVFTTLPTQLETGFPVHVNGNFLLDDSRKHLDTVKSGAGGIRAWWNEWLLHNVALPAYLQLLSEARQFVTSCDNPRGATGDARASGPLVVTPLCAPAGHRGEVFTAAPRPTMAPASLDWYYSLFPRDDSTTGDMTLWKLLCNRLYEELAKPAWRVLASHHANPAVWEPWRPCTGPELGVFHRQMHREETTLFLLVVGIGVPLTQAPYWLLTELNVDSLSNSTDMTSQQPHALAFQAAYTVGNGSSRKTPKAVGTAISPAYLREFLRIQCSGKLVAEQSLGVNKANLENVAKLLNYCLDLYSQMPLVHEIDRLATGLPLLLTQSNKLNIFGAAGPAVLTKFPSLIADRLDTVVNVHLIQKCPVLRELLSLEGSSCARPLSLGDIASSVRTLHPCLLQAAPVQHLVEHDSLTTWLADLWAFIVTEHLRSTWHTLRASALHAVSFIPVTSIQNGQHIGLLVSPEKAGRIIRCSDRSDRGSPGQLLTGLAKLGMYLPAFSSLLEDASKINKCYNITADGCTPKDDYVELISQLEQVSFSSVPNTLTLLEAKAVLTNFVGLSRNSRNLSHSQRQLLCRLPIYPAVGNKAISLAGMEGFFQMDDRFPRAGCDMWWQALDKSVVVLEKLDPDVESFLTERLTLRKIDEVEVLVKLIIPALMRMTEDDRIEHVRHIRDKVLPIQEASEKTTIVERLKPVPFVTAEDGQQRLASELFKHGRVFDLFVDPLFFASEFWHGHEWHSGHEPLLKKLGFTATIGKTQFIELAKSVESTWFVGSPAHGLKKLSKKESVTAAEELIGPFNKLSSPADVGDIKFVFPVTRQHFLPKLLGDSGGRQLAHLCDGSRPVSLRASVPHKWYDIVWTVQPVCSELFRLDSGVCKQLGMNHEPDLDVVLAHFCNLMQALTARTCTLSRMADGCDEDRERLKNIIKQLYTYLNAKCQQADGNVVRIRNALHDKPCILVDDSKLLLPPGQVTEASLQEDSTHTEPYLSTLPSDFLGSFPHLMSKKCLDISDHLTAGQCVQALQLIKHEHEIEKSTFDMNKDPKVYHLIQYFFKKLFSCSPSHEILLRPIAIGIKATPDGPERAGEIFLPSCTAEEGRENCSTVSFVKASEIVMNNWQYYFLRMSASNELQFLPTFDLKMESPQARMAKSFGVQLLSEVASEEFDDTEVECDANRIFEFMTFEYALGSKPEELHGVLWNMLHMLRSSEFSSGIRRLLKHAEKDPNSCNSNLERLRSARIVVVRMIQTFLKYNGKTIVGSEEDQPCHYKLNPRLTIFIRNETAQSGAAQDSFMTGLAMTIRNIVCGKENLLSLECLRKMLYCDEPSKIDTTLTKARIAEYHDDEATKRIDYSQPPLGEEVPTDRGLFDPSENPEELYFGKSELVIFHNDQEDVYVLAKIIRETTPTGNRNRLTRSFLIDIGVDDEIAVSVNDLYRFKTPLDRQSAEAVAQELPVAIFTGTPSAHSGRTAGVTDDASQGSEMTMDEARAKIKEELRAVFSVKDENERKKVFRRMQMRWHPDKHPGQEPVYTKAFQYLMNLYEHVSKGGSIDSFDDDTSSGRSSDSRDWAQDYSDLYSRFRRGRRRPSYRQSSSSRDKWRRNRSGDYHQFFNTSRSERSHRSASESSDTGSRADAERFLAQARSDLSIVREQVRCALDKNNALACFLAQQAVEKALKAALCSSDQGLTEANRSSNDVVTLALHLRCTACENVLELAQVVSHYYTATRYPTRSSAHSKLPFESYSVDDAHKALEAAVQIIDITDRFCKSRQSGASAESQSNTETDGFHSTQTSSATASPRMAERRTSSRINHKRQHCLNADTPSSPSAKRLKET